jgi:hypothetical protein
MMHFTTPPFGPLRARPVAFREFPATYFWTWMALDWFFGATPLEGWEEVASIDGDDFLVVSSHLSQVAAGMDASGATGRYFIKSEDLAFARKFPVLLAHQAHATVPPEEPADMLIGTHAIILEPDAFRLCRLENLGETGAVIWNRLKQGTTLIPLRATLQGYTRTFEEMNQEHAVKFDLWERARSAARDLVIQYWRFHEDMKAQESQPPARPLPATPSVLRGTGILIPQLDPLEGVLTAISHAGHKQGGWTEIDAIPTYTHQRPTSITEVSVRPHDMEVLAPDLSGQLWHRVRQFNDIDGDIILAMIAQLVGTPHESQGGTWITGQQILEYRGIQPKTHRKEDLPPGTLAYRKAGHRYEDLEEIARGVNRIRDMHITVRTWRTSHKGAKTTDKPGKPRRKRIFQQESYLFTISDFIQQAHLSLEGDQLEEPLTVAWYYRPGTSLEGLLLGPNYRAAWLLQQALRYDPVHERWEKRLARYFTFQLRMNPDFGGATITRTIGAMIDELALPINTSDPSKTKERFERAMNRLKENGIISSWGPEDQYQRDMESRPRYNWLPWWLTYELTISADTLPPQRTEELLTHLQVQRRQRRAIQQPAAAGKEQNQEQPS